MASRRPAARVVDADVAPVVLWAREGHDDVRRGTGNTTGMMEMARASCSDGETRMESSGCRRGWSSTAASACCVQIKFKTGQEGTPGQEGPKGVKMGRRCSPSSPELKKYGGRTVKLRRGISGGGGI